MRCPIQEMNGSSKFSTAASITRVVPEPPSAAIEKSFYNPFTVDLSLNDTNPPATKGRNQYRCNGRECNHPTEVKRIYLREVAVGTDNDLLPLDQKSRSSIVEKSRRITFEPDIERHNSYHPANRNNINENVATSIITNRRSHNYNKASLNRSLNFSNAQHATTNKEIRNYAKEEQRVAENGSCSAKSAIGNDQSKIFLNNRQDIDNEENDYTPIPVKQLIQEFEKTCRPVLQYKQFSPKVIPIMQRQSPLDNDISRFFERQNSVNKYKYAEEDEHRRMAERQRYEELAKLQDRCNNGYSVSTDDTEYTTDDGSDSETNDYSEEIIYREKSESSSIMNGDQDYCSSIYRDECSSRRRSVTSEEVENFCNGSGKFTNTESHVPVEAKSLLLSMIASQEDILQTIKHLRNTPVLGNLLGNGVNSPDCEFTVDASPDVG
ncbi:unnamed protein product, partial [Heterotrigona itama]